MPSTTDSGLIYNTSAVTAVTISSSYGSATLRSSNYPDSVITIDASPRTSAINIVGNSNNNRIIGSTGNSTLNGGAGNDTLTGNGGKNYFIYDGGTDVITDYTAGNDTVKISGDTISNYTSSGSDITFKTTNGSVKISGGKSKAITIIDSRSNATTYDSGIIYNGTSSVKATNLTVTANYANTLASSNYGSAVVTIDASARTKAINITGNDKNNIIKGGTANDTLAGGAGNDTLTGGGGKNVFVHSAGNDVITDYVAGTDTLRISDNTIASYYASGNDMVFKTDSGSTVKIVGGKDSAITIVDSSNKALTYQDNLIFNNNPTRATAMTIDANYSNTLTADGYGTSVVTIDATARTRATNIAGNAKNNSINGGTGNDTIYGGKGNDTIRGNSGNDTLFGEDGNDVFIYSSGDGNDVIADYTAGQDTIRLADGTISSYYSSGSDMVFKIGTGSIRITDGSNTAVTFVDASNQVRTYQNGLVYNNTAAKANSMTITSAYSDELPASVYGTAVATIDASTRTKAINITGNTKANLITGTSGNDTLYGATGNDTLVGNGGANTFIYSAGNDVISDYSASGDTLKIASGTITSVTTTNNDVAFKVGSGTVKVLGAANSAITIIDSVGNANLYKSGALYGNTDSLKASVVTLTAAADTNFTAGDAAVTINASVRTAATNVTGNAKNNVIITGNGADIISGGEGNDSLSGGAGNDSISGGDGNDTIVGGKGEDTLYGGAGADVFIYNNGDGADVIADYTEGEDVISLVSAAVGGYSLSGDDVIIKLGTSNVTVKNGANKKIRLRGATSASNAEIYLTNIEDPVEEEPLNFDPSDTDTATAVTINANYESDTFNAATYPSLVSIDASASTALNIIGNDNSNYITGSTGNDTISLGDGSDTYYYSGGSDFDVIVDYNADEDKIYIGSNSVGGAILVNDDMYFMVGKGVLKLTGTKDKAVTVNSGGTDSEYINGVLTDNTTIKGLSFNANKSAVTVDSAYQTSLFDATAYANVVTIEANVTGVNILGNKNANLILNENSNSKISIDGGAGNDTIINSVANVTINGGVGRDTIENEGTRVSINGDAGADFISNYGARVTINSGASNDTIENYGAYVSIEAGTSNDSIDNYGSRVTISGGNGNDTIENNGARVSISGGAGVDRIITSSSFVTISGGAGNDQISLGSHSSNLIKYAAGDGNDTIYGYAANDTIDITANSTYTTTRSGSDVVVQIGSNYITLKDYSGGVNISGTASGRASNAFWFIEDNNYVTGDELSPLIGDVSIAGAAGNLSIGGGDSITNFEFDFTVGDSSGGK